MKHTLRHCEQNFKDHIVAAYFFNARGDNLKTPLGILRSLSSQLLRQESSLYERFVPKFRDKLQKHKAGEWEWRQSGLKEFLLSENKRCQSKPPLLPIDSLDECNESDVQNVVDFLEGPNIKASSTKVAINIWLSSRYYPSIRRENTLELVLKRREGHGKDTSTYVRDELIIRDEEIEKGGLKKKSRVNELSFDYPFLEYASTYVLGHAEVAQGRSIKQKNFIHCPQQQDENFERLRHFHNAFERIPGLGCDKGATPLYTVSFYGCPEVVKVALFEEQADVNAQGGFCGNALQEESIDVDCKDDWGRTPLSWAVKSGHKAIVQLLLESSKVEADSKDDISRTSLSYAEAVVRLLQLTPPLDISSLAENPKRAPTESSTSNVSFLCLTSSNFNPTSSDAVWEVVSPTFLEPNNWIFETIPVTQQRPRKRYVYVWQCVSGCLIRAKSQRSLN